MSQTHTHGDASETFLDARIEEVVRRTVNVFDSDLRDLSLQIHDNPELCFEEIQAHDNITAFLERSGFATVRHSFGIQTSFIAEYGKGGRIVTLCAEYDALPQIGHGCGHNLIAVSSIAAFLGTAEALKMSGLPGRVRLLGCPAEEGGAGKVKLINAGAFDNVDAALMMHPTPGFHDLPAGAAGVSYGTCLATCAFEGKFTGRAAHGAAAPWAGNNALDAASLAYTAIALQRQQIWPTDRIQINIGDTSTALNIIPDRSTIKCSVRSKNSTRREELKARVEDCLRGAALATRCELNLRSGMEPYADIRPNEALCTEFTRYMRLQGQEFVCDLQTRYLCSFGTDMGNVSYEVPSFHGTFTIPTDDGTVLHTKAFTKAARSPGAHTVAMEVAKGMAAVVLRVIGDDTFASEMQRDFAQDVQLR